MPSKTPRPRIMGIVNVTPDSFSDGGLFEGTAAAVAHARRIAEEGADLIDIGGESTRPGFEPVPPATELARVVPVLEALAGTLTVPLSIDTTKAVVARAALQRGVTWVNDIWGLQSDPAMARAVADHGATVVMMHNRSAKDDAIDIADDMLRFFDRSLTIAARAGIAHDRMLLDPGIGFGKTPRQQVEAVAAIPRLLGLGLPILIGVSRKSFLGRITGSQVDRRLIETVAANLAAFTLGASVFRVHDVAEHVAAFKIFEAFGEPTRS